MKRLVPRGCLDLHEGDVGVDVDVQVPARAACVQWGRFRTRQVGIDVC